MNGLPCFILDTNVFIKVASFLLSWLLFFNSFSLLIHALPGNHHI